MINQAVTKLFFERYIVFWGVFTCVYFDDMFYFQLKSMLGEPMKGYGETTRRGRRRYVR